MQQASVKIVNDGLYIPPFFFRSVRTSFHFTLRLNFWRVKGGGESIHVIEQEPSIEFIINIYPRPYGMEMVIRHSDRITLYPLGRGCSSDTQERLSVSIDSSVIVF
jgi:hypothetical protein